MQNLETTFTFRNLESTNALKEHTLDKLIKLEKYLIHQVGTAHIIFKVEGPRHVAEITLNIKGGRYVGLETSTDMYASVEGAVHKLETQLARHKEKVQDHEL